jgi:hypothetical protein
LVSFRIVTALTLVYDIAHGANHTVSVFLARIVYPNPTMRTVIANISVMAALGEAATVFVKLKSAFTVDHIALQTFVT